MNCEVCAKSFSGIVPYNQHMVSEKHKRKVETLKYFNPDSGKMDPITLERINNVRKHFSDEVNGCEVDDSVSSSTIVINFNDKVLSQREDDTILPTPKNVDKADIRSFLRCKICDNMPFSSSEAYEVHITSAMHLKRVIHENKLLNSEKPDPMENYSFKQSVLNPMNIFECQECRKMFSGPVPFQQHMVSEVHRKKVEQLKMYEQFEKRSRDLKHDANNQNVEIDIMADINRSWYCDICQVPCSGILPYQQHLQGNTHLRNLKKADLLKLHELNFSGLSSSNSSLSAALNNKPIFAAPSSLNMETDCILPEALQGLSVVSATDLNIREFYPDVEVNFDDEKDNGINGMDCQQVCDKNVMNGNSSKIKQVGDTDEVESILQNLENSMLAKTMYESTVEYTSEMYEECKLCCVKLNGISEALSHFESVEHFMKKYRSQ